VVAVEKHRRKMANRKKTRKRTVTRNPRSHIFELSPMHGAKAELVENFHHKTRAVRDESRGEKSVTGIKFYSNLLVFKGGPGKERGGTLQYTFTDSKSNRRSGLKGEILPGGRKFQKDKEGPRRNMKKPHQYNYYGSFWGMQKQ